MNVTITLDDDLLARVRELARKRGISLQELLRQELRRVVGERDYAALADELERGWSAQSYRSDGRPFSRDDLYADRIDRRARR
jgi:predicted transcriptional regulator